MPTREAIADLVNAVFAKRHARVMEAHSAPDCLPREFQEPAALAAYIHTTLNRAGAVLDAVVYYPDMGGRPVLDRIEMDQDAGAGHSHQYAWTGWGLIHLQRTREGGLEARIASTSLAESTKWSDTNPPGGESSGWNWAAIQHHISRLQRVLKKVA